MKITEKKFSLMGILNVTPDSFFDGGNYTCVDRAVDHAMALEQEGADYIDIGGASSRPGATVVSIEEECARVIPVVEKVVKQTTIPVSVDTTSSLIARRALDAGATVINDISAGRHDKAIVKVAAEFGCCVILMHSRGTPQTMMHSTRYTNIVDDVMDELSASVEMFLQGGVARDRITLDPGIGFAKTAEQNLALLNGFDRITSLGYPVLLGTSRKSFLGAVTGRDVAARLPGSLGSIAGAFFNGFTFFRVHDVAATADFLKVITAIGTAGKIVL